MLCQTLCHSTLQASVNDEIFISFRVHSTELLTASDWNVEFKLLDARVGEALMLRMSMCYRKLI